MIITKEYLKNVFKIIIIIIIIIIINHSNNRMKDNEIYW